jgi:hypothetical protein
VHSPIVILRRLHLQRACGILRAWTRLRC